MFTGSENNKHSKTLCKTLDANKKLEMQAIYPKIKNRKLRENMMMNIERNIPVIFLLSNINVKSTVSPKKCKPQKLTNFPYIA